MSLVVALSPIPLHAKPMLQEPCVSWDPRKKQKPLAGLFNPATDEFPSQRTEEESDNIRTIDKAERQGPGVGGEVGSEVDGGGTSTGTP